MRIRGRAEEAINYKDFSDPYIGMATMIFVQSVNDLLALGERDFYRVDGEVVWRQEIITFLHSRWAKMLASEIGVNQHDMTRYADMVSDSIKRQNKFTLQRGDKA